MKKHIATPPGQADIIEDISVPETALIQAEQDAWLAIYSEAAIKIKALAKKEAKDKHHHNLNYKIDVSQSLYPKRTFTFGAVSTVEWYSDVALTNLILTVDILYNYDGLGLATDRTVTRTWKRDDDTDHAETKITNKDYRINPQDQMDEAVRRRTNNVRQTNIGLIGIVPGFTTLDPQPVSGVMTATDVITSGQAFFDLHDKQESLFVKTGSNQLEVKVRTEADTQFDWMNASASALGIPGVVDVRGFIIWNLSGGIRTS